MEVAATAFTELIGSPILHLTWENDPDCINIISAKFPEAKLRGDVLQESAESVVQLIDRYDSHQTCVVFFMAAPPCPDFSQINSSAEGLSGVEGSKFTKYAELASQIETLLGPRETRHLVENVVMQQRSEAQHISSALHSNPVVVDAADFGLVGRPRLWWTRTEWRNFSVNPLTGAHLRWGRHQGYPRLYVEAPLDSVEDIYMDGYQFHPKIQQQVARLPCFTTPAPDDSGRSAPKQSKQKLDQETRNRWMTANRQYAPWHYQEHALLKSPGGDLVTPTIQIKEQVHHLPYDYTYHPEVEDRARHRMLGNSWHLGVTKFLLLFLVQCTQTTAMPMTPKTSTLDLVCSWARGASPPCGPLAPEVHHLAMPPTSSMQSHWTQSTQVRYPTVSSQKMPPLTIHTLALAARHLGDLPRMRQEVLDEVQQLVDSYEESTFQWWSSLPAHLQKVYWHADRAQYTQVPVYLELLQRCGFPGLDDLAEDLHWGFDTIGTLHSGCGWLPRLDGRYSHPLGLAEFHRANKHYVLKKLNQGVVDEHWQVMLDEILEDRAKGRLEGPFTSPTDWPVHSVGLPGEALQPLPDQEIYAAFCFSVCQSDKVRRCEDYRRSHHNETVQVWDVPHHDSIDAYAKLALWWLQQQHGEVHVWAHDLDSAYRQLGVRRPQYAYVILCTPRGPMVFRHCAMCFGATASVWGFNRFADSMVFLFHHLFLGTSLHFVDDFGGIEPSITAHSAFVSFDRFFSCLGLHMKVKKAEPPSRVQRLLGVIIEVESNGVRLSPCPERMAKLLTTIDQALASNTLTPEDAQRLAGKLVFLQTTCFGQLGTAATHCLYSRAAQGPQEFHRLTTALEASLLTITEVLQHLSPRWLTVASDVSSAVMYTDAFFAPGDNLLQMGKFSIQTLTRADNGWGFVVTMDSVTYYSHGVIPHQVIRAFGSRRAFIYMLEAVTPLICLVLLREVLPSYVLAFVDNQASLQALRKGYGRDVSINGLLCLFWALVTRMNTQLVFEWVPSHLNISDPISRRDFQMATELSWCQVPATLDEFFKILIRCSHDLHYAAHQAAVDCLDLQPSFRPRGLVQDGDSGHEMVRNGL